MGRDYSEYSIPELQEALAHVDDRRYPENKSALEAELQARRDSGEFGRFLQSIDEAREQQARDKINFAKRMQKPIAVYLVVSAIYILSLSGTVLSAADSIGDTFIAFVLAIYLFAMLVGGIGLLLKKTWSYRVALIVLVLQVVKIQSAAVAFSAGSLFYLYIFVSSNPDAVFGLNFKLLYPELKLAFGLTPPPPVWIGANVIAILMIMLLGRVHYEEE